MLSWGVVTLSSNLLADEDMLHRQVHATYPDGTAMSVNFYPSKKDDGLLSTRQAAIVTSQEAHDEHVSAGFKSTGTWTFFVGDSGLEAIDDQDGEGMPRGHASVDFTALSRGARERVGKRIKAEATRTWPQD